MLIEYVLELPGVVLCAWARPTSGCDTEVGLIAGASRGLIAESDKTFSAVSSHMHGCMAGSEELESMLRMQGRAYIVGIDQPGSLPSAGSQEKKAVKSRVLFPAPSLLARTGVLPPTALLCTAKYHLATTATTTQSIQQHIGLADAKQLNLVMFCASSSRLRTSGLPSGLPTTATGLVIVVETGYTTPTRCAMHVASVLCGAQSHC